MANFESVKMTNPYGIEDTVLKLSIDSEQNSYRLSNLITEPDSYVFVIWHKTNTPCTISINVFGEIITSESNSQWTKVVKVKKVSDVSNKNIDITPPINSTTFFYEAYLSRGTIDTSWSPAPEDDAEEIIGLKSEIKQTAERIDLTVGNMEKEISQLSIRAGKIEQTVKDTEKSLTSKIESTAGEINQKVEDAKNDLKAEISLSADNIIHTVGKNHVTAIRYIRDWLNGSNLDTKNKWAEINVFSKNVNIAKEIIPTCKDEDGSTITVEYPERYTDGDTSKYIEAETGWKCLELDLGHVENDIDYITIWHEYPLTSAESESVKIFNHRLQVSTDNKTWFTLYDSKYQQNGGYKENQNGKTYYINDTIINC